MRDLWAYQLAISPLPPVPDDELKPIPVDEDSQVDLVGVDEEEKEEGIEDDKSDRSSPDPEDAKEEGNEDDDDSELLRRLSEDGDSDKDNEEEGDTGAGDTRKLGRKRRLVISDTVVTLLLALWVLRYPIMNVDLER